MGGILPSFLSHWSFILYQYWQVTFDKHGIPTGKVSETDILPQGEVDCGDDAGV